MWRRSLDLVEKFLDRDSYAAKPIGKQGVQRAIELFRDLERSDDEGKLISALRGES